MSAFAVVFVSVAYGLVGIATACRVATLLAWSWMRRWNERYERDDPYRTPFGEYWAGGAMLGSLAGIVWPLTVAATLSRGVLFAPPREIREQRQREYIAKLEHELGIARKGEQS